MNPKRERGDRGTDEEPAKQQRGHQSRAQNSPVTSTTPRHRPGLRPRARGCPHSQGGREPSPAATSPRMTAWAQSHQVCPAGPPGVGLQEAGLVALAYNLHRLWGLRGQSWQALTQNPGWWPSCRLSLSPSTAITATGAEPAPRPRLSGGNGPSPRGTPGTHKGRCTC